MFVKMKKVKNDVLSFSFDTQNTFFWTAIIFKIFR